MNKRLFGMLSGAMFLALVSLPVHAGLINLESWVFNIDGATSDSSFGDPVPAEVDFALFDEITGLGEFIIEISVAGDHSIIAFLDHEIDEDINTFHNEFGDTVGAAATSQSWEIDEPSYIFGDIYWNVIGGSLDNTNGVPSGSDDDVSMALGWDFTLAVEEIATIVFDVSLTEPETGLYLVQNDPESAEPPATIYFSSSLTVEPSGGPSIPAPATLLLLGAGLLGMGAIRGRKAKQA